MQIDELRQNIIVQGPIFPEPVQISMTQQMGEAIVAYKTACKETSKNAKYRMVKLGGNKPGY